jgi:hypothetical protein
MICPITQEEITTALALPCGHVFEEDAINSWLENHTICPICRNSINNNVSCGVSVVAPVASVAPVVSVPTQPPRVAIRINPLFIPFRNGLARHDGNYSNFYVRFDNPGLVCFDGLLNVLEHHLRNFMLEHTNATTYKAVYRNIIMQFIKDVENYFIIRNKNMYQILSYFQNNLNITMRTGEGDVDDNLYMFSIELFDDIYMIIKQKMELFNLTSGNQSNSMSNNDFHEYPSIGCNDNDRNGRGRVRLTDLLGKLK